MTRVARVIAVSLALVTLSSCYRDWHVGGIYSVSADEGEFGVVKVLALDDGVVSVRLYSERFPSRPTAVASEELTLGKADGTNPGIGHLPVTEREFAHWYPVLIRAEAVTELELDGYRYWKEHGNGAAFDSLEEEEPSDP